MCHFYLYLSVETIKKAPPFVFTVILINLFAIMSITHAFFPYYYQNRSQGSRTWAPLQIFLYFSAPSAANLLPVPGGGRGDRRHLPGPRHIIKHPENQVRANQHISPLPQNFAVFGIPLFGEILFFVVVFGLFVYQ